MLVIVRASPECRHAGLSSRRSSGRHWRSAPCRIDLARVGVANRAGYRVAGERYEFAHAVAEHNGRSGRTFLADCVNPWPLTRGACRSVAGSRGVAAVDSRSSCSGAGEHGVASKVETAARIAGHTLPAWRDVLGATTTAGCANTGGGHRSVRRTTASARRGPPAVQQDARTAGEHSRPEACSDTSWAVNRPPPRSSAVGSCLAGDAPRERCPRRLASGKHSRAPTSPASAPSRRPRRAASR